MKKEIDHFLETHPYYLNKSELVRDALRHIMHEEEKLSAETLKVIEEGKEQVEKDEGSTLAEVKESIESSKPSAGEPREDREELDGWCQVYWSCQEPTI